jgi:hypothetical protein
MIGIADAAALDLVITVTWLSIKLNAPIPATVNRILFLRLFSFGRIYDCSWRGHADCRKAPA